MLALYYLYFFLIAVPILFSLTVLTCIIILIGTAVGNGSWWGYYPAMVWARAFCMLSLVKVSVKGRENIDKQTSYVFVA
ncbi:MAG: 1-acyl-sn-glycerol-3-phosphate acyltransferase, partial [Muribaculaceae bacterium]|nr:1-acyl-sn-glycerol-3-phosphate acyltransferase [Muribaculaceae bacterium]